MEQPSKNAGASKKVVVAILVGIVLLILAHPIMVLLCLAFVGVFALALFQTFVLGRKSAWDNVRTNAAALGQTVIEIGRWVYEQVDKHLYPAFVRSCEAAGQGCRYTWEKIRGYGRFLGAVLVEMVCGAFVGAILGLIGGTDVQTLRLTVPIAACAGALLGILVGLSRRRSSSDCSLGQTGEGLP